MKDQEQRKITDPTETTGKTDKTETATEIITETIKITMKEKAREGETTAKALKDENISPSTKKREQ